MGRVGEFRHDSHSENVNDLRPNTFVAIELPHPPSETGLAVEPEFDLTGHSQSMSY